MLEKQTIDQSENKPSRALMTLGISIHAGSMHAFRWVAGRMVGSLVMHYIPSAVLTYSGGAFTAITAAKIGTIATIYAVGGLTDALDRIGGTKSRLLSIPLSACGTWLMSKTMPFSPFTIPGSIIAGYIAGYLVWECIRQYTGQKITTPTSEETARANTYTTSIKCLPALFFHLNPVTSLGITFVIDRALDALCINYFIEKTRNTHWGKEFLFSTNGLYVAGTFNATCLTIMGKSPSASINAKHGDLIGLCNAVSELSEFFSIRQFRYLRHSTSMFITDKLGYNPAPQTQASVTPITPPRPVRAIAADPLEQPGNLLRQKSYGSMGNFTPMRNMSI